MFDIQSYFDVALSPDVNIVQQEEVDLLQQGCTFVAWESVCCVALAVRVVFSLLMGKAKRLDCDWCNTGRECLLQ